MSSFFYYIVLIVCEIWGSDDIDHKDVTSYILVATYGR